MHVILLSDDEVIRSLRSSNRRLVEDATKFLLKEHVGMIHDLVRQKGADVTNDVKPLLNYSVAALVKKVQSGEFENKRTKLSTYLYAIARNILNTQLRNRHFETQKLQEQLPLLSFNDLEKTMEEKEKKEKVAAAILKLDKLDQKVLFDYWWKEKSLKEIAKEMGISQDATKQRHHRCIKRLRKLLENELKDWFNS
jgi:RNA polymerase sigma factor (sigma-70 family)